MNLICPTCGAPNPNDLMHPVDQRCTVCGNVIWREAPRREKIVADKVRVEPGPKQKAWLETAKPVEVLIGGQKMFLEPKCFSTGSVGYGLNGKFQMPHGDSVDRVQASANFTVVGSKDW